MKEQMMELQKLKGIGEVLSKRLVEASYDTIAKVAAAEKHGLERVAGLNAKKLHSIVTQARQMTGETKNITIHGSGDCSCSGSWIGENNISLYRSLRTYSQ